MIRKCLKHYIHSFLVPGSSKECLDMSLLEKTVQWSVKEPAESNSLTVL